MSKVVICKSLSEAIKFLGLKSTTSIVKVLKGEVKTAKGWECKEVA